MIYENVFGFATQGIATIPLRHHDKRPEASLLPMGRWEHYQSVLPETTELESWFRDDWFNYGVVTGWRNLIVLDFDNLDHFTNWQFWVREAAAAPINMLVLNTLKVRTHRGVHVYFRLRNNQKLSNRKFPGIDLKLNGYVVGPDSIHPSGDHYSRILSKNLYISKVDYLSDILPAILLQDTQTNIIQPVSAPVAAPSNIDIWARVNQPSGSDADLVDAIRAKFKIEDLFPQSELSSNDGRWRKAACPFHDDKAPSFWIDTKRMICNCYSCNFPKPLDIINLYAALYGMDNRTALYALAAKL